MSDSRKKSNKIIACYYSNEYLFETTKILIKLKPTLCKCEKSGMFKIKCFELFLQTNFNRLLRKLYSLPIVVLIMR